MITTTLSSTLDRVVVIFTYQYGVTTPIKKKKLIHQTSYLQVSLKLYTYKSIKFRWVIFRRWSGSFLIKTLFVSTYFHLTRTRLRLKSVSCVGAPCRQQKVSTFLEPLVLAPQRLCRRRQFCFLCGIQATSKYFNNQHEISQSLRRCRPPVSSCFHSTPTRLRLKSLFPVIVYRFRSKYFLHLHVILHEIRYRLIQNPSAIFPLCRYLIPIVSPYVSRGLSELRSILPCPFRARIL